ncbi:MAG: beta-galactosidase trimerization domain-containing protein [Candidatus Cryptobacteroides sp.]
MLKRVLIFILSFVLLPVGKAGSQETEYPLIGAQVFIEPGQTAEDIDGWFRILKSNGMQVARIRLFGSHIMMADGSCDFSIYDTAFESAARHGVKIFATLFPPTDELTDVGGFKFPSSEEHLAEVGEYIDKVVTHFKDAPALYAWVLQNEPGTGSASAPKTELAREKRSEWDALHPVEPREGWLKADFSDREFLTDYLSWYMQWLCDRVIAIDPVHGRHLNPHQILETLPEYDFNAFSTMLTSLGASMHASWHFGIFNRNEYPLGVSIMSDIIRSAALGKPFWITEMQGGNVTASGNVPVCPSSEDIYRWLWTGIGAGAEGIMFWTLNQRRAVSEAGEWGLLTYQNKASDRLEAASKVVSTILSNKELFTSAEPLRQDVALLYNRESFWIQSSNSNIVKANSNPERGKTAVIQSIAAAYKAISASGVVPEICDMDRYDWTDCKGRVIVLADILCIPDRHLENLRSFVEKGGRLIATGLTGYYDEWMRCRFMGRFPLEDVFGASVSEYKVVGDDCTLPVSGVGNVPAGLWRGELELFGGSSFISEGRHIYGSRNTYGKGEAIWIPSMIDLGSWHNDLAPLVELYRSLCPARTPIRFVTPSENVLLRMMDAGDRIVAIFVNMGDRTKIRLDTSLNGPEIIFDNGASRINERFVELGQDACIVSVWKK